MDKSLKDADIIAIRANEERTIPWLWTGQEKTINLEIRLAAPGAKVELIGVLIGRATHQLELETKVVHLAPNTHSKTLIRGVLADESRVNYKGVVRVERGAKESSAHLRDDMLLLSKKARAKSIPSLEILENDITAGHAATATRVDEEQIFYLTSRGLDRDHSTRLIVEGFVKILLEKLTPKLQKTTQRQLELLLAN